MDKSLQKAVLPVGSSILTFDGEFFSNDDPSTKLRRKCGGNFS